MAGPGPRPVSGLRRKAVLATLALRGGEVVGTDRLRDAVWGQAAPLTAPNTLQSHVSATDVRAVFSWSYRALGREAARLFRLLGGWRRSQVTALSSLTGSRSSRSATPTCSATPSGCSSCPAPSGTGPWR